MRSISSRGIWQLVEPEDDLVGRGAWSNDDQSATARAAWSSLPDTIDEASDIDRAARAFAQALQKRKLKPTTDPETPTIVLVSPEWRTLGKTLNGKLVPEVDDGSCQLSGYLFVVPANLGAAYRVELLSDDLGATFEWIEDILDLGGVPALVLNPGAALPELRIYSQGLSKPKQKSAPLYFAELDISVLDLLLAKFWAEIVCVPGGGRKCERLWNDPDKFGPVPRPERVVQNEMYRYLRISLPSLTVKEEENVPLGRLDIRLSGRVGSDFYTWVNHAVIELKALTKGNRKLPFTDNKTIKMQIKEGVVQAASYRQPPQPSRIAMLACYDMRPHAGLRKDTCLSHVRPLAKSKQVELRRWPLFPVLGHAFREYAATQPIFGN